jgi:phosphate acyltransferase
MRIAVDAMGGDVGAAVVVPGALEAARARGVGLALVGKTAIIQAELAKTDTAGLDLAVVEAPDEIAMDEHPAQAVRRKPNSSIVVALGEVKAGRAQAMVSAGNSGAVMAGALLALGRIPGIDRPAIGSYIPSARQGTLVLDLGAVTDPRPHHLVQWATMGRVYAERILDRPDPTIGLLSNGEEPGKGNQFVQEVYPLLAAAPGIRFHGNVEGKDVPLGVVDVVVTDGFTGNIALKVAEGTATFMGDLIRAELTATLPRKLAALVLRPAFRAVRAKMDYASIGGAPLLGVQGTVIIAHGRSNPTAIRNAVGAAIRAVNVDLPGAIRAAAAEPVTGPERGETTAANRAEVPATAPT